MKRNYQQNGLTLAELVIVIGIIAILLTIGTINLVHAQRNSTLDGTAQQIVADFKEQQVKAMEGDSEGRTSPDAYGIYCNGSSYVLFHGASYNSADTTNFTIPLDSSLQFSAARTVIFSRVSGEVQGYNAANSTIVVVDTTNSTTETIQFNQLGVITNVN